MKITQVGEKNRSCFRGLLPKAEAFLPKNHYCLGAVENKLPCGALIFTPGRFGVGVDWIYVDPEYRRRGVGKVLMKELEGILEGTSYTSVFASYSAETEERDRFFEAMGFGVFAQNNLYSVPLMELWRSKKVQRALEAETRCEIQSLREEPKLKNRFRSMLWESVGTWDFLDSSSPEFSFLATVDGKDAGCLIASEIDDRSLQVDFLWSREHDEMTGIALLTAFMKQAVETKPAVGTEISFVAENEGVVSFVKALTGMHGEKLTGSTYTYAVKAR